MEYKEIAEKLKSEYFLISKNSVIATFFVMLVTFFGGLKLIYDRAVKHGTEQAKMRVTEEIDKLGPKDLTIKFDSLLNDSNTSLENIKTVEGSAQSLVKNIRKVRPQDIKIITHNESVNDKIIIASGQTQVDGWNAYGVGVFRSIDISKYNFNTTPQIFTSLTGGSGAWVTRGTSSIYKQSKEGFEIYLAPWYNYDKKKSGDFLKWTKEKEFKVNWIAIGTTE